MPQARSRHLPAQFALEQIKQLIVDIPPLHHSAHAQEGFVAILAQRIATPLALLLKALHIEPQTQQGEKV